MRAIELLAALKSRGVRIWLEQGRLRVNAPVGVLTREIEAQLTAHRAEILEILAAATQEVEVIPAAPRDKAIPLSLNQQRLWFLDRLDPQSSAYTIAAWKSLPFALDTSLLERSIAEMTRRHEILRTTFPDVDGNPYQKISAPAPVPVEVVDLRHLPAAAKAGEVERLRKEEASRTFDLEYGPLYRFRLLKLADAEHILLFTIHHIICDGWSLGLIGKELAELFIALSTRRPAPLPDLQIQYADYAVWQRVHAEELLQTAPLQDYVRRLEGTSGFLPLPTDRPRPMIQTHRGSAFTFRIPSGTAQRLRSLSRKEGVTLFTTLASLLTTLLHRYTNQNDIVIGCPVAGRNRIELESLIGMFVNTVVLRTDMTDRPTFKQLLSRMWDTVLSAFAGQDVPFDKLIDTLHLQRTLSHSPLFQVALVLHNTPVKTEFEFTTVAAAFDLTLYVTDLGGELSATFEYNTDLFDESTIQRMSDQLCVLAGSAAAEPERGVAELRMLPEWESNRLLVDWNATATGYPRNATIHGLFEAIAERTPRAVALQTLTRDGAPRGSMTYSELNRKANRLAAALRKLGVAPGAHVGLCMDRSADLVVSILAILKAGGCYVPLDPAYPQEKLRFMLEDSAARLTLTTTQHAARMGDLGAVICLDRIEKDAARESDADVPPASDAESLAYIMYTSGSSGQPKGTCVTHRNIVRLVRDTNYLNFAGEVFLLMAPISFDASTLELWGSLLNGSKLALAPAGQLSLAQIAAILQKNGVTTLWLTAGLFHLMVENELPALKGVRQLLAGGDVLSVSHVKRLLAHMGDGVLVNGYGPTENTTFTCCYRMTRDTAVEATVPIGQPISNTSVYVLDERFQPVPMGVIGELYAAGDGVARGYWNRPDLDAAAFLPDPFSSRAGARMYRTGDLVRYREDGMLEFIGRKDTQVKIRGHRVELGEIEAALDTCPGVDGSVVVVDRRDGARKDLVAFVLLAAGTGAPAAAAMRSFLQSKIPSYMIPGRFVPIGAFPLTSNGKIDRKALLAGIDGPSEKQEPQAEPSNIVEIQMLALWQRVLGNNDVQMGDDFFEIGGHSLLAVELFAEIHRVFQKNLSLSTLFGARTPKEMAALLTRDNWKPRWESVVTIQSGGTEPPLFIVPGVGGNVVGFAALAKAIGKDQPIYGLQSLGFDGTEKPLTRIADIAARFVADVSNIHPTGPFTLAGTCMGGLVAYEMAQQFAAKGRPVDLLLLIETWPPAGIRASAAAGETVLGPARTLGQRIANNLRAISRLKPSLALKFVVDKLRKVVVDDDPKASLIRVANANYRAAVTYDPAFYGGKTCLILASERPISSTDDPRLDWKKMTAPGLEIHMISGKDSGQMLKSPSVEKLGSLVRSLQDEVTYQHASVLISLITGCCFTVA